MNNFILQVCAFFLALLILLYWYIKFVNVSRFGTILPNEKYYKEVKSAIGVAYIFFVVSVLSITTILNDSSKNASLECGPGDASCESNVRNHINQIKGLELNFISYIENKNGSPSGKFRVGVLKQDERGINQFSVTISTDCNCKVIDAGGIASH
jgi:hypothetical protein